MVSLRKLKAFDMKYSHVFIVGTLGKSVQLTGIDSVYKNGSFILKCEPVGFSLSARDMTYWYHNGDLVLKTNRCDPCIKSGTNGNDDVLTGSWNSVGDFRCKQRGIASNIFTVVQKKGKNVAMSTGYSCLSIFL